MDKIELVDYVSNEGWKPNGQSVGASVLARSMKAQNFADVLSEYLNIGMKDFREGKFIGSLLQKEHRTIQGSIIRFCLGVIIGLSTQQYTDARNEVPIATAKKIAEMYESGELSGGMFI